MTLSPDTVAIDPDLASRGERIAAGIAEGRVRCRVCDAPIISCELCEKCAKGNDPFPPSAWWSELSAR